MQLDTITLPDSLHWEEEFSYSKVAQSATRTLDGSMVLFSAELIAGVPITLSGGDDRAWIKRTDVVAIKALADVPGAIYSLTIGLKTFDVVFRNHEKPAFQADPVFKKAVSIQTDDDYFIPTIRLMTI
jgi:hypothetical protein